MAFLCDYLETQMNSRLLSVLDSDPTVLSWPYYRLLICWLQSFNENFNLVVFLHFFLLYNLFLHLKPRYLAFSCKF